MKLSNTKEHLRIGFIAGLLTGFALPILHMETLWLAVTASWACIVIAFELGQWAANGFSKAYLKAKWQDSLLDIAAGLVAFSLPVVMLCYGMPR